MDLDISKVFQDQESIGGYQKFVLLLMFMISIPQPMLNFSPVFVLYTPPHRCRIPVVDEDNATHEENELLNYIPVADGQFSKCSRYASNSTSKTNSFVTTTRLLNISLEPCLDGWEFYSTEGKTTAAMEFNLVCDQAWKRPLVATVLMLCALFISPVAGPLTDRFGRRKVLLGALLTQFVCAIAYSFCTSYEMMVVVLGVYGLTTHVLYVTSVILAQEFVKTSQRAKAATLVNIFLSAGFMLLAPVAYLCKDWRWIIRIITVICAFYISYYWTLPESPRWLQSSGQTYKAVTLMKKVLGKSKRNRKALEHIGGFSHDIKNTGNRAQLTGLQRVEKDKTAGSLFTILRNRVMLKRSVILSYIWFATFLCYFTLSYNTSNIGGNRYWNCFISATAEIPANVLVAFAVQRFGRRASLFGCFAAVMIACGIYLFFTQFNAILTISTMIARGFSTSSMAITYIYCAEVYPTLLRSTGVGIVATVGRTGAIASPFLVYLGEQTGKGTPFYIMAGVSLVASLFTLLLPETKNSHLPNTMVEAIALEKHRLRFRLRHTSKPATAASIDDIDTTRSLYEETSTIAKAQAC